MNSAQIHNFLQSVQKKKIAVVGDIILDEYIWGSVHRISPEAPVPVVEVNRDEQKVGGAGNVALSLRAIGGDVSLFGIIGQDVNGEKIRSLLAESGIHDQLISATDGRPTSTKTRVIASRQQVVRIDRESRGEIEAKAIAIILERLKSSKAEALVLSDYGKGILSRTLCQNIIEYFSKLGTVIVVDPKGRDFEKYRGATVVTPNQEEAGLVTGEVVSDANVEQVARDIQFKYGIKNILITRSERGMFLLKENGEQVTVESKAREVFDVTGAGDTVVAFLTAGLSVSLDFTQSVQLANLAAGVSVGHIGVYAVQPQDLLSQDF